MESQLEDAVAVAVYAMVASRLVHLLYQPRATPDAPASVACTDDEWKALHVAAHRSPDVPRLPPPLSTAVIWWPASGASPSVEAAATLESRPSGGACANSGAATIMWQIMSQATLWVRLSAKVPSTRKRAPVFLKIR